MIIIPKNWTSELAEETGWHMGDGTMNFYNGKGSYQLRGHIFDDKEHYFCRIKPIYKKLYGIDISLRNMPSSGVFGFQIWNSELVKFKSEKLNLPLGKKFDYNLPKELLKNEKLKISFLRGLFDTDGCIYMENKRGKPYPRVEIKITCENLSNEIKNICLSLGVRTTRCVWRRKEKNWRDMYCISVRGKEMVKKWMDIVQPQNPKHIFKWKEFIRNIDKHENKESD